MEANQVCDEDGLQAAVAELRGRFPRTQDLYREVCILLFFRHGITPTANKVYQLVRKGSMSAPTEAVRHFWSTLREQARVSVEHADLPDELRVVAGDMVAAIWKTAQSMSLESVTQLRQEVSAAAESARDGEAQAKAAEAAALGELERTRERLSEAEVLVGQLRQEIAAAAATLDGAMIRLEDARQLQVRSQTTLEQLRIEHAAERDKLAQRHRLAEERFFDMDKRALVEIDRERTAVAKLQKLLDAERAEHAKASERLRADCSTAQTDIALLREQVGVLRHEAAALKDERDRAIQQLQATRTQLEATIRQAATNAALAQHIDGELQRLREAAAAHAALAATSAPKSRARKAAVKGT